MSGTLSQRLEKAQRTGKVLDVSRFSEDGTGARVAAPSVSTLSKKKTLTNGLTSNNLESLNLALSQLDLSQVQQRSLREEAATAFGQRSFSPRAASPVSQRSFSPRAVSPLRQVSPRAVSPLRQVSPRAVSPLRQVSPRASCPLRQFSPRAASPLRQISPRAASPGAARSPSYTIIGDMAIGDIVEQLTVDELLFGVYDKLATPQQKSSMSSLNFVELIKPKILEQLANMEREGIWGH